MIKYLYFSIFSLLISCKQTIKNTEKSRIAEKNTDTIIDTVKHKTTNRTIDTLTKNLPEKVKSKGIIPENYTELKESPANGRKMERIIADLDNDKIADMALIVQNEKDFANYLSLIHLTSQNRTSRLQLINEYESNIYPVQLIVKKNVLEIGYFLDGTAAFGRFLKFRFDEKKKKMKLIGYDTGYRMLGGYCHKTFNLTNGNYIVKLQKSLPTDHTETFKGKQKIKDIFIDDITVTTIKKLDKVGSQFEPE